MQNVDQHVAASLKSQLVIHDEFEARYWARVLGLTRSEVRAAFGAADAPDAPRSPDTPASEANQEAPRRRAFHL